MVFDIRNWLWNQIFASFWQLFCNLTSLMKKTMPFLCYFCDQQNQGFNLNFFYQILLTWCKTYHRVRSFLSIECLTPWPRSMAIRSRIARRSIRSWHSSLSWAKFSLKLLLMPAKLRKFVIKVRSPFSTNWSLDMVNFKMSFLCLHIFQKTIEMFSRISALASKKRSNQKSSVREST